MKKLLFIAAGVFALAGMGYLGTWVAAQDGVKPAGATAESKPTLKIGVINITKVIKEFKKANALGDKILQDAQRYEAELKKDQEMLKAEEAKLATIPGEAEKEAHRKAVRNKGIELQEKDLAYQKDIRKRRDDMAIEINKDIQRIIDSLARHYQFEMVLTCPDVATKEERGSLSDAMRRMTAPATWIAWHKDGLDITEEAIRWLNHYCKAPGDTGAAPATTGGTNP